MVGQAHCRCCCLGESAQLDATPEGRGCQCISVPLLSNCCAHCACSTTTVGVLLYRKHVITEQPYIAQLIETMEAEGLRPLPIFINGVEAHTVVRPAGGFFCFAGWLLLAPCATCCSEAAGLHRGPHTLLWCIRCHSQLTPACVCASDLRPAGA